MPKLSGQWVSDDARLASEWHSTKNVDVLPSQVTLYNNKKRWWQCPDYEDHSWEASPNQRVSKNTGCPKCSGRVVDPGRTDLGTVNPELAAQLHSTLNGGVTARDIMPSSNIKRWWQCPNHEDHVWEASPNNRSKGRGCGKCGGRVVDPGRTDLGTCDPVLALDWDYETNDGKTPQNVMVSAAYRAGWKCHTCGHKWTQTVNARHNGAGCPACSNQILLPEKNSLLACHPEIAAELHPTKNNGVTADMIRRGTDDKYWWYRKECDHEWYATVNSRTEASKMTGCAVCAGSQVQVGKTDMGTTHPLLAAQLHPTLNGEVTAQSITAGSGVMLWWSCPRGHAPYEMAPYSRKAGRGCGQCAAQSFVSEPEVVIAGWLRNSGLRVETTVRSLLPGMEVDIFVPDHRFAVEFNGVHWHSEARGKGHGYHRAKWLAAKNIGVDLVQVWEDDYRRKPDLVKRLLLSRLGLVDTPVIDVESLLPEVVDAAEARLFMEAYHVHGFVRAARHVGLRDVGSGELLAVLSLRVRADMSTEVVRHAFANGVGSAFNELVVFVAGLYESKRVVVLVDNGVGDGGLFEKAGFVDDGGVAPGFTYNVHGVRYTGKHALVKEKLATGVLSKVWDAGSTRWVRTLVES